MGTEVDSNQKLPSLLELRDFVLKTIRRLDESVSHNGLVKDLTWNMMRFEERYHQLREKHANDPEESRRLKEVYSALLDPYYSAWNRHLNPHIISGGTENGSSKSYQ